MTTADPTVRQTAVYVYEAPVRAWHWINALSITVLLITGYFIGAPLPSLPGEASDHYVMGYIRFAHFAAAYIFVVGFIFRIYWAIVGMPFWNRSRTSTSATIPWPTSSWWPSSPWAAWS